MKECSEAIRAAYGKAGGHHVRAAGCFPANATVCKKGTGSICMDALCVGDEILVADSEGNLVYEPVLTFLHLFRGSRNVLFEYIKVTHSAGELVIHPDHLLNVTRRGLTAYMAARDLVPSDFISSVWIDGSFSLSSVTAVEHVSQKGLYCPLTYSGTIVVDGVWCSCYSPPPKEWLGYVATHETCHFSVLPLRLHGGAPGPGTEGVHPYCQVLISLTSSN